VIILENFSFALFTPPLGDYQHLLVGELRHRLPLARVQERRNLCARQDRQKPHQKVRKIREYKKRSQYPDREWVGVLVAPTDDLRGRALIVEPAAEAAPAATPATTAKSATASPSRWSHGARCASGLEESWLSRMRRMVLAAERKRRRNRSAPRREDPSRPWSECCGGGRRRCREGGRGLRRAGGGDCGARAGGSRRAGELAGVRRRGQSTLES
jgi:hypothetical protein